MKSFRFSLVSIFLISAPVAIKLASVNSHKGWQLDTLQMSLAQKI